jgi:hypothetical protein
MRFVSPATNCRLPARRRPVGHVHHVEVTSLRSTYPSRFYALPGEA